MGFLLIGGGDVVTDDSEVGLGLQVVSQALRIFERQIKVGFDGACV